LRSGFSEAARKALHIAMGLFALLLAWLTWWQALAFALVAFLHNYFLLPLYGRRKVFRGEANEKGRDVGILLYPASVAVLIVVFHSRLEIAAAAWGLLAFGDGFATVIGRTVGGPRLPWNRAKSWSGWLAFLVFGFLAARFLYVHTVIGRALLSGLAWTPGGFEVHLAAPAASSSPFWWPQVDTLWAVDGSAAGNLLHLAGGALRLALGNGWGTGLVLIVGATALLAATLESLPLGLDDNILVPLASGGFLFCLTLFDASSWSAHRDGVGSNLPWAVGINVVLAAAAYAARSVSWSGVVGGILMGGMLYACGGWRSFMMLVVFFVLGTATTKMGYARKAALGIAQEKGGRRGAKNAVANCGMGALLAFVAATTPYGGLATLGLVAAFATAACDTVSSEIGQAYGRTPYLVTNFRRVPPGTDGAVSLEGTLAGIAGAALLAAAALALGLVTFAGALLVVAAAFFGATLESYMGAIWERSKLIDNEAINFANTLAGALFAIAVAALLPSIPFLARG
jgi:uncharacterized protein (TIGR00297 family)